MSTLTIVLLCVLGVLIIGFVVMMILGRRNQKKQEAQQAEMEKSAQTMSLYVIDMKKMHLKDAGLPKIVLESTPRLARLGKLPIVKVKVANRVMSLVCDAEVFKTILPKQELKAKVSGIYIVSAKRVRGPIAEEVTTKNGKKKKKESFIDKLR